MGCGGHGQLTPPTRSSSGLLELPPVSMNKVLLAHGRSHGFTTPMAALALQLEQGEAETEAVPRHQRYLPPASLQGKRACPSGSLPPTESCMSWLPSGPVAHATWGYLVICLIQG